VDDSRAKRMDSFKRSLLFIRVILQEKTMKLQGVRYSFNSSFAFTDKIVILKNL